MRRFLLQRDHDVSGVSGTGVVAEGTQYTGGWVSLVWLGDTPSMVFHQSMTNVEAIHGHGGNTWVNWLD
jgi:hypothetical protein